MRPQVSSHLSSRFAPGQKLFCCSAYLCHLLLTQFFQALDVLKWVKRTASSIQNTETTLIYTVIIDHQLQRKTGTLQEIREAENAAILTGFN